MSKILDLLTGILPGKNKSNGYYLELGGDGASSPETSKPVESKLESSNGAKPSGDITLTPDASTSNGKTVENKQAQSKSKKVSIKERKKAEKAKKSQAASSLETASNSAATPAKNAQPQEPAEVNFATKYLIPSSTNGRRRPGANMNSFLEMARNVKTPIK